MFIRSDIKMIFYIFKFTHLKLTKNRIVSLSVLLSNLRSTMNSLDRAFVIAIIDCVSFIGEYPAVADPTQRQSRTGAAVDAVARADQEHS